jgi:hypothetical protein
MQAIIQAGAWRWGCEVTGQHTTFPRRRQRLRMHGFIGKP